MLYGAPSPEVTLTGLKNRYLLVVMLASGLLVWPSCSSDNSGYRDGPSTSSKALRGTVEDWRASVCRPYPSVETEGLPHATYGAICNSSVQQGMSIFIDAYDSVVSLEADSHLCTRMTTRCVTGTDSSGTVWLFVALDQNHRVEPDAALTPLYAFGFSNLRPTPSTPAPEGAVPGAPRPSERPPRSAPTTGRLPNNAPSGVPTFVRTVSGKVRCIVETAEVYCQRNSAEGFLNAPPSGSGGKMNHAVVTADGYPRWGHGNIPAAGVNDPDNDLILQYDRTYSIVGWTIEPNRTGTRFANQRTGRGMWVSIERVEWF